MPQVTVGDPLAVLTAVEKKGGVVIPPSPASVFNWSISPADGSVAELNPGPTPEVVTFHAKAPGVAVVTVSDAAFPLLPAATLSIEVVAAVVVPDSLEIVFTPGS